MGLVAPPPTHSAPSVDAKLKFVKLRERYSYSSQFIAQICLCFANPPIEREASITRVLSAWGPHNLSCHFKHMSSQSAMYSKNELVNLRPTHRPSCSPSQAQTT